MTWTVVEASNNSTFDDRVDGFENVGLKDGLPYLNNEVDLLKLFLNLYPGNIEEDLNRMNEYGKQEYKKAGFTPVTMNELVTFFGLLIGAV